MRKMDEINDPNSCFNKAKDEEILFVLLERDPCTADTIRFWAQDRINKGINLPTDSKIIRAREMANQLDNARMLERMCDGTVD